MQTRDFIHVEDVAKVMEEITLRDILESTTYNVGTGIGTRIIGLASLVKEIVKRPVNIIYETYRAGEIKHSVADVSGLRERIEFNPIRLKEGIRKLYQTILENKFKL